MTGSVEVLDEFILPDATSNDNSEGEEEEDDDDDDDENNERIYKKRMVSSIEARIWIKRT